MQKALGSFEEIGCLIKSRRLAAGMTQCELAEKAGLSEKTICRFEHGHISPRTLAKIKNALKIEIGFTWRPML